MEDGRAPEDPNQTRWVSGTTLTTTHRRTRGPRGAAPTNLGHDTVSVVDHGPPGPASVSPVYLHVSVVRRLVDSGRVQCIPLVTCSRDRHTRAPHI